MTRKKAKIILKDGYAQEGYSFGSPKSVAGEVIFNTSMVGYPEALTDPSYRGQILVLTYPLIGNYGVPSWQKENRLAAHFESEKIQIAGLLIADLSLIASHHQARQSLDSWLKSENVPGIFGVDTRAITKILRAKGSTLGKIIVQGEIEFIDPNERNLVAEVSTEKKKIYGRGKKKIILIDCGLKNNIIRCLLKRGCQVIRVPYDYNFLSEQYDAIVVSNGPGNPIMCRATIGYLRQSLKGAKPIFGICLGNQLLALAAGAKTYKLKYGHHACNQPCLDLETGRCYITSQNHGYAVDAKTLPAGFKPWFVNANDRSNEGIKHKSKPFFSVQFHPEASPGPNDTEWLFDKFLSEV